GYELNIGERICSKCYNSHIAYNRHNRYKKKTEDVPYKIRKPIEMEVEANTSLQNQL
ncbi:9601_t:CDS:1, partial [Entrophospora sp. SA101]